VFKEKTMEVRQKRVELDIKYIAELARIELDRQELDRLGRQLKDILEFVNKLEELDVKDVPPTTHVLNLKNVFRQDRVLPSLSSQEVLKNAPSQKDGFFKVPRVIQ
jgi:aspartyl-tRNA(Asn)/glutamyl-tRNA(Gln) amidotransferase subunit C